MSMQKRPTMLSWNQTPPKKPLLVMNNRYSTSASHKHTSRGVLTHKYVHNHTYAYTLHIRIPAPYTQILRIHTFWEIRKTFKKRVESEFEIYSKLLSEHRGLNWALFYIKYSKRWQGTKVNVHISKRWELRLYNEILTYNKCNMLSFTTQEISFNWTFEIHLIMLSYAISRANHNQV